MSRESITTNAARETGQIKLPVRFNGTTEQLEEKMFGLGKFQSRVLGWMRHYRLSLGWDGATASVKNGFVVITELR